jgi:signal transduction histidine kinase/CheY-like chemotaxis protein
MVSKGKGLYTRLMVIITFAVTVPILLLTLGSLYVVRDQLVETALGDLERQADFRARFIEAQLLEPVIITMRLSENQELSHDLQLVDRPEVRERLQRILRAFLEDQPEVRSVAFLDVRGAVVLGVDREERITPGADLGQESLPVFSSSMSNPYPVSVVQINRPGTGIPELAYFREIRNPSGYITHRLMLSYALDLFDDLPEPAGRSWLLSPGGTVLNRTGSSRLPVNETEVIGDFLPNALREQSAAGLSHYPSGSLMLVTNRITIPSTGADHLILMKAVPESVFLADFYRLVFLICGGALVVVLLTALVYSVVIRRTTQPLNELARAVENLGVLDWEGARHLKPVRDDEVGLLTKRFLSMSKQLSQAFSRLTRLNSRLIVTLRSIADGVVVTDSDEQVSLINTAAEELTGWSARSARGLPVSQILPDTLETPIRYRARHGGQAWVVVRQAEMKAVEGAFLGSVYTIRDITKEREYLDQLIEARDAAQDANQTKSEFLAIMSHELRTPLNPIIAFSSLLLNEGELDESTREMIQTIHDSARHQLELIQEILDYCALEGGQQQADLKVVELDGLIQSCVAQVRYSAESKGLRLEVLRETALPDRIQTDRRRLCQILQNLLLNAVKFTSEGSVCLRVNASGASIQFFVDDTGIGIAPGDREKIFEPFTQADSSSCRRYGGTGLGLTISRELARILGGQLDYMEREGPGSTFRLMLPVGLVSDESQAVDGGTEPLTEPSIPAYRILLVEDEQASARAAQVLLESLGQNVVVVGSGEAALEALASAPYDLIFLDIQLPGISGVELVRRIHEENSGRTVPHIIAQTAQADSQSREAFLKQGMDEVLTKPFSLEEVQSVLEAIPV